jgi:hypothetical protein
MPLKYLREEKAFDKVLDNKVLRSKLLLSLSEWGGCRRNRMRPVVQS